MRRLVLLLGVTAICAACATRKAAVALPLAPPAPPPIDAAAQIRRGCYQCLDEAFAVASAQKQPDLAFEAAALLVLRSRELGMPADTWLERARTLAAGDPTRTQFIRIITAIPPDVLSGEREIAIGAPGEVTSVRKLTPTWRDALQAGGASLEFRTYLDVALMCAYGEPEARDALVKSLMPPADQPPLVRYRAALCHPDGTETLAALLAADARFADIEYPLGSAALRNDQEEALRRFQRAAAAFPTSLSARTSIGKVHEVWEEWVEAATAFEEVLALRPTHPDALIGRTAAVSRQGRYQDGIDAATKVIEGGRWYLGQAFYWRAWNHLALKNFETARVDTDRAKSLMVTPAVFVLSGLVEWGVERRERAEQEFSEALVLEIGQCEAAFYLGVVRAEMRKGPEGLAALAHARQCFEAVISVRKALIASVPAGKGSEQAKARQVAAHDRVIGAAQDRKEDAIRIAASLQKYVDSLTAPPPARAPSTSRRGQP